MSISLTILEDLLQSSLNENQTISSSTKKGILSGNHSEIVSTDVDLTDGTTLQIATKTVPTQEQPSSELAFYNVILPTLRFFQEKEDIDELNFIPVCYGGRNLNDQYILLLEDLKAQRYTNKDSFDLGTTRQILKDLASFHAIPLALKLKDPKVFDTKIKRYLNRKEVNTQLVAQLLKTIEEESDFAPYVDKIKEKFEDITDKAIRAPFSTMIHNECFFKNIMVKTGSDGFADVKLIDFQHCSYGSLAEDLILLLYSSVDLEVLEEHNDGLIEFYHSNFVRVLEECRCDPTPFSLDALFKEMKIVASESQFVHVVLTLFANMKKPGGGDEEMKKRLVFAVRDFMKRNWV